MNELEAVEAFARLQSDLREPFCDREAVLAAAMLDEATLGKAQRAWAVRLAAPDAALLREHYAGAFTSPRSPSSPRYEDAAVDATLPVVPRNESPLPFAAANEGTVPPAVLAQKGASRRSEPPSSDAEETAFLPPTSFDAAVTPFERPTRQGTEPKGDPS